MLNGTYWFEVHQETTTNLTLASPNTEYIIKVKIDGYLSLKKRPSIITI